MGRNGASERILFVPWVSAYLPELPTKRGLITWPSAFFAVPLSSSLSSVPIDMGL